MSIPTSNQLDADIDYFATDEAGHILHVASGGGLLPASVASSEEELLALHQFFLTRPEPAAGGAQLAAAGAANSYPSAVRYARRGLFSFVKNNLHEPTDTQYSLVAKPLRPLTVAELPPLLAALLRRTRFPGRIEPLAALDVSSIL